MHQQFLSHFTKYIYGSIYLKRWHITSHCHWTVVLNVHVESRELKVEHVLQSCSFQSIFHWRCMFWSEIKRAAWLWVLCGMLQSTLSHQFLCCKSISFWNTNKCAHTNQLAPLQRFATIVLFKLSPNFLSSSLPLSLLSFWFSFVFWVFFDSHFVIRMLWKRLHFKIEWYIVNEIIGTWKVSFYLCSMCVKRTKFVRFPCEINISKGEK